MAKRWSTMITSRSSRAPAYLLKLGHPLDKRRSERLPVYGCQQHRHRGPAKIPTKRLGSVRGAARSEDPLEGEPGQTASHRIASRRFSLDHPGRGQSGRKSKMSYATYFAEKLIENAFCPKCLGLVQSDGCNCPKS